MTKTFKDLQFESHHSHRNGVRATVSFDNGYSASIIRSEYSYGGNSGFYSGFYELSVLHDGELVYDTEVTGDVLGWLDEDGVTEAMAKISRLDPRPEPERNSHDP